MILEKATLGESRKRRLFLENAESKRFFSSSLQICLLEKCAMKIVEATIGNFQPSLVQS